MTKKVSGKWVLVVIAFIVSCLIWYVAITNEDARIKIPLGKIEVEFLNEETIYEQGLAYYVDGDELIEVSVNVIQEKGWLVKNSDIRLTVDLEEWSEKNNILPIHVAVINNQSTIGTNYKLKTNTVTIRTEKLVEKEIPVTIQVAGEPEDDCKVGLPQPEKNTLKIKVPESLADLVVSAEGSVDISGYSADYEGKAEIKFLDERRNVINCDEKQVFPEQDSLNVYIPIGNLKEVEIQLPSEKLECQSGYRCTSVKTDKKTVQVLGAEAALKSFDAIKISAGELNAEEHTEAFEKTFELSTYLPEGVYLYDSSEETVTVSVKIEKLYRKSYTISSGRVQMENVPASLKATVEAAQIVCVIEGLEADLEELQSTQIYASVDLSGCTAGTYEKTVRCTFKNISSEDTDVYNVVSSGKITIHLAES